MLLDEEAKAKAPVRLGNTGKTEMPGNKQSTAALFAHSSECCPSLE